MDKNKKKIDSIVGDYKYGFKTKNEPFFSIPKGISEEVVSKISKYKKEPEWMTNKRLEAYREFAKRPNPNWGPDLSFIDFEPDLAGINEIIFFFKKKFSSSI